MNIKKNKIITCALPYVNNDLHLGHIFSTFLPSDVLSRFFKLQNYNVIFFSGSDCHGIPIIKHAKYKNISCENIIRKYHKLHIKICKSFDINYNFFLSTNGTHHKKFVKKIILKLFKKNLIYWQTNNIYLCKQCVLSSDKENCNICHKENDRIKINDLFFFYDVRHQKNTIANKFGNFDKEVKNLDFNQPKNISRIIKIGVKIPFRLIKILNSRHKQKIYVWFEALLSYLSFLEKKKKLYLWNLHNTSIYQFIGKDNLFFHACLFPQILQALNFKLVNKVSVSNFLNINKIKFSKSKNLGIFCEKIIKSKHSKLLINIFRGYLMSIYGQNDDSNFNWTDVEKFYQNIMINKISNVFFRFNNFIFDYVHINWYDFIQYNEFIQINFVKFKQLFQDIEKSMGDQQELNYFMHKIINIIDETNTLMNLLSPWNYKNNMVIYSNELLFIFLILIMLLKYLYCIFPGILNIFLYQHHISANSLFLAQNYNISFMFDKIMNQKILNLNTFSFPKLFYKKLDWTQIIKEITT